MKNTLIILGIFFMTATSFANNGIILPKLNSIEKIEIKIDVNSDSQKQEKKCYSCSQDMDGNLYDCVEVSCCPPVA